MHKQSDEKAHPQLTNNLNNFHHPKAGGRIHIIDGVLDWPLTIGQPSSASSAPAPTGSAAIATATAGKETKQLMDIMDTLKQCDKFDGFVTLAEGTGLTQILKQGKFLLILILISHFSLLASTNLCGLFEPS